MESIRLAIGRRSALWSNADFIRFWTGETIANFGNQLGLIALPIIAAVSLGASPFQMGLLTASTQLPRMVVGIFAGSWVDQRKRLPIMIWTNVLRAATLMAIPLTAQLGILNFTLLLLISVMLGVLGIVFDSAWNAMVPNLVDRKDMADANGKLWASMGLAQIMGPALAGSLIAWLTDANVLAITAISMLLAAWYMKQIQKPEPEPEDQPDMHAGPREMLRNIKEGYVELGRNPVVRPLTTTLVGSSLGSGVFAAVFLLFLSNNLELSTRGVGIMYAIGGTGALLGSTLAAPLAARYGFGRIITIGPFIQGASNMLFAVGVVFSQWGIALAAVGSLVGWIFVQAYDINRFSLRQSVTPPKLMGRIASSTMTLIAGATMLGSLVGGAVGQVWGIGPALALGAVIQIAAGFLTLFSSVPAIHELPNLTHSEKAALHDPTVDMENGLLEGNTA